LACYCGVAPFEHTSGTSFKGKSRVSSFANKKLKKLLHLVAMSVSQAIESYLNIIIEK
jgi:transposase